MPATARTTRRVGFVLAFAIGFAPAATCLAAVAAAAPKMACHEGEQHPAQVDSIHGACCPSDAPNSQSPIPAHQALDPSAPTFVLVTVLPVPAAPQIGAQPGVLDIEAGIPKPSGIAAYVLGSSFRI